VSDTRQDDNMGKILPTLPQTKIQQRSYRRCPGHSEHYEIALWFRELASAGEWGQFRHDDPAKLLKSRSRLSARLSLLAKRHDATPHRRSGRHLGAVPAHHAPPLPAPSR